MRFTSTIALCLLLGSSWAQGKCIIHDRDSIRIGRKVILQAKDSMLIARKIGIRCHHDSITIHNYDSVSVFLEIRPRKKSYPISFRSLYANESILYQTNGKTFYLHVSYDMMSRKGFSLSIRFKRPPRKHRGRSFFYESFLSISASLSAIYCLSDALLKK